MATKYGARKGLTGAQMKLIEKMADPKTLDDVVDALKDPNSLASKYLNQLIENEIEIAIIVYKLLDALIKGELKANKLEELAIHQSLMLEQIAKEKARGEYEKIVQRVILASALVNQPLNLNKDELTSNIKANLAAIEILDAKIDNLDKKLGALGVMKERNDTAWEKLKKHQIDTCLEAFKDIKLIGPNGKEMSDSDGAKFIHDIHAGPPPSDIMRVYLGSIYESQQEPKPPLQSQQQKDNAQVDPSPPDLREEALVVKNEVGVLIRALRGLARRPEGEEEAGPNAILAALREEKNKKALNIIICSHTPPEPIPPAAPKENDEKEKQEKQLLAQVTGKAVEGAHLLETLEKNPALMTTCPNMKSCFSQAKVIAWETIVTESSKKELEKEKANENDKLAANKNAYLETTNTNYEASDKAAYPHHKN